MVKKENVQSSGITRRDFVKGVWPIGGSGLGIATILPGGIITAASAADTTTKQQVGKQGDGIYIDGVAENMKSKTYTLEFVQAHQAGGGEGRQGAERGHLAHHQ